MCPAFPLSRDPPAGNQSWGCTDGPVPKGLGYICSPIDPDPTSCLPLTLTQAPKLKPSKEAAPITALASCIFAIKEIEALWVDRAKGECTWLHAAGPSSVPSSTPEHRAGVTVR